MHKILHTGAGVIPWLVFALVATAIAGPPGARAQPVDRRVALTFDDLVMTPEGGTCDAATARVVNKRLLAGLARVEAPATGFVNASRTCGLDAEAVRDPILEAWLDAGHVLGNHSWSHPDLERTPVAAYLADVEKGGAAVDSLLAERGVSLVWFRHPFLHAGDTPAKKRGLARFLDARGWRVAPVTVDNQEYVYAYVYHAALARGDGALAERAARGFLEHLDEAFAYFERRSREVVGREIAQVLLLHDNRLVADHIDEILARIQARGYRFVPLAEALEDPAYRRGDPWTGEGGPSWIERWAVEDGGQAREGPREAAWASEAFHRLWSDRSDR